MARTTKTVLVDAWMALPGARVVGHQVRVREDAGLSRPSCGCGQQFLPQADLGSACLRVAQHLQDVVRHGAAVIPGGDGDASGDREPRQPLRPHGGLSVVRRVDEG